MPYTDAKKKLICQTYDGAAVMADQMECKKSWEKMALNMHNSCTAMTINSILWYDKYQKKLMLLKCSFKISVLSISLHLQAQNGKMFLENSKLVSQAYVNLGCVIEV